jgi:D-arabinono-1,4-lactone oxidase
VHSPIEVRVANTVGRSPKPYMDTSFAETPSLYLNATLYRPYNQDPPCRERYYQAFEHLMKEYNGRPHWAKNFQTVDHAYLSEAYGDDMSEFLRVRNEVDPEGMFLGAWHRRTILPSKAEMPAFPLEEKEVVRRQRRTGGVERQRERRELRSDGRRRGRIQHVAGEPSGRRHRGRSRTPKAGEHGRICHGDSRLR